MLEGSYEKRIDVFCFFSIESFPVVPFFYFIYISLNDKVAFLFASFNDRRDISAFAT